VTGKAELVRAASSTHTLLEEFCNMTKKEKERKKVAEAELDMRL